MSYHKDKEVNSAIIRLLDALCSWERNTWRGSKLILIHDNDEDGRTVFAIDGKPLPYDQLLLVDQLDQMKRIITGAGK